MTTPEPRWFASGFVACLAKHGFTASWDGRDAMIFVAGNRNAIGAFDGKKFRRHGQRYDIKLLPDLLPILQRVRADLTAQQQPAATPAAAPPAKCAPPPPKPQQRETPPAEYEFPAAIQGRRLPTSKHKVSGALPPWLRRLQVLAQPSRLFAILNDRSEAELFSLDSGRCVGEYDHDKLTLFIPGGCKCRVDSFADIFTRLKPEGIQ